MANKTKNVNAPETTVGVTETAITNVPPAAMAPSGMPSWLAAKMDKGGPRGLEKVDSTDIIYPRLLLMQGLSPLVAEGKNKVGEVVDNLSLDTIATPGEEFEFIPVVMSKTRMYLNPISEGGGMKCRSDDSIKSRPNGVGVDQGGQPTQICADCIHKEWNDAGKDEKDRKPKCTQFYNIVGLLPQRDYTAVVWSGKATNMKVMRRFISMAVQTKADFFAGKYLLKSVDQQNGTLKFKNWDFRSKGWVTEEEYKRALQFHASIQGKTWAPDTTDLETQGDVEGEATFP